MLINVGPENVNVIHLCLTPQNTSAMLTTTDILTKINNTTYNHSSLAILKAQNKMAS